MSHGPIERIEFRRVLQHVKLAVTKLTILKAQL